jgi:hypothetical protein
VCTWDKLRDQVRLLVEAIAVQLAIFLIQGEGEQVERIVSSDDVLVVESLHADGGQRCQVPGQGPQLLVFGYFEKRDGGNLVPDH